MKQYQRRNQMSKSDQKNTKTLNQTMTETMNKYDGTNYIYDGSDDTINTEADMKKKFTAQDNYKLLKSVANNQEKKQFRDIERKYKKKTPIEPRRESSNTISDTTLPLNISDFKFEKNSAADDDTLKKIIEDRNKPDPDFFRGLGTFFIKRY